MDFIVVCPHCGEYIGVDRFNFFDVDFFWSAGGNFSANGTIACPKCGEDSIMDVKFEPIEYEVRKVV